MNSRRKQYNDGKTKLHLKTTISRHRGCQNEINKTLRCLRDCFHCHTYPSFSAWTKKIKATRLKWENFDQLTIFLCILLKCNELKKRNVYNTTHRPRKKRKTKPDHKKLIQNRIKKGGMLELVRIVIVVCDALHGRAGHTTLAFTKGTKNEKRTSIIHE